MSDDLAPPPDPVERALARTAARVLVGRSGPAYRTSTWLKLREDHAAARDAVQAEVDLGRDFGADRIAALGLFEVRTRANTKAEYLRRPDLGRKLAPDAVEIVRANCPAGCAFQIAIGDGLSATAIRTQAAAVLDRLVSAARSRNWSVGRPFLVRYCRVGVMNDIGAVLTPEVVVLLIGERPGLATAESLSAYMAFRPRPGHTDADRNLISNIHAQGVSAAEAAERIVGFAQLFYANCVSGVSVKETLPATTALPLA
jgi:ethanolamine ammonia-lyase small subunit